MSRYNKVVWSEGMFLNQHLFQQADCYHEDLLHFRMKPLTPFYWGLTDLEIDQDGLPNGTFTLLRCKGVMPDGLPIQIPEIDEMPENRPIKPHFPPSAATLDVYLTIPASRPGSLNYHLDGAIGSRPVRYRRKFIQVSDETTGENECEAPVAQKNFKILFFGEPLEDTVWIKIAELTRISSGAIALQDSYIPPSLALPASDCLMTILHRLVEILSAKSSALSEQRRHVADFGTSDVANFWLLHTANSFIPVLSHFYDAPNRHPEQLYVVLVQLAGELTTFTLEGHPRELPRYDHTDLEQTFGKLEEQIRYLLETVIPTRYVLIPLEKTPELLHLGHIHDERLLKFAQFYLGVNAKVPANQLIEDILSKAKISSSDQINALIGRAVRGVELNHEPVPPSAIPVKSGFKYFYLNNQGRWWEAICQTKALAIYLPDEFPELRLELVAVKEEIKA